jgi:DNA polymerase elongation subunit (family B)
MPVQLQNIPQILFIDIETVSLAKNFDSLPEALQKHWKRKAETLDKETEPSKLFSDRGAIYAEFGKVIVIGVGFFHFVEGEQKMQFRCKAFSGDDEKEVLSAFAQFLQKTRHQFLCAHNGKEFDFPYLCRRMVVQGIQLPSILDISGKKPWEVAHFDTLELWKFGDRKSYTSLDLMAAVLDVPGSKDDIDGSQVGAIYYNENDLNRIAVYCKKDVVTLAQVFLRLNGHQPLPANQIVLVE